MAQINVAQATSAQLDWLVAICEGVDVSEGLTDDERYSATAALMWPIIQREVISIHSPSGEPTRDWVATRGRVHQWGADGLIAAARCYVASKMGLTVEVPEELT